jgi:hypothetical protein
MTGPEILTYGHENYLLCPPCSAYLLYGLSACPNKYETLLRTLQYGMLQTVLPSLPCQSTAKPGTFFYALLLPACLFGQTLPCCHVIFSLPCAVSLPCTAFLPGFWPVHHALLSRHNTTHPIRHALPSLPCTFRLSNIAQIAKQCPLCRPLPSLKVTTLSYKQWNLKFTPHSLVCHVQPSKPCNAQSTPIVQSALPYCNALTSLPYTALSALHAQSAPYT